MKGSVKRLSKSRNAWKTVLDDRKKTLKKLNSDSIN